MEKSPLDEMLESNGSAILWTHKISLSSLGGGLCHFASNLIKCHNHSFKQWDFGAAAIISIHYRIASALKIVEMLKLSGFERT